MKNKSALGLYSRALWAGVGPGIRYILAIALTGISVGLFGLSVYLVNTPASTQQDISIAAQNWVTHNCENRLKEHDIPFHRDNNEVIVRLESGHEGLSRNVLVNGDIAMLACPGMKLKRLCIGPSCQVSEMALSPNSGSWR